MKAPIAVVAFVTSALVPPSALCGPLVVWGAPADPLVQEGALAGDFVSVAAGGALQTLAIRANGTLYLSGEAPHPAPVDLKGAVHLRGHGSQPRSRNPPRRQHRHLGPYSNSDALGVPPAGQFVAVTGGANHSVALDTLGHVVVWGPGGTPAPTGISSSPSQRDSATRWPCRTTETFTGGARTQGSSTRRRIPGRGTGLDTSLRRTRPAYVTRLSPRASARACQRPDRRAARGRQRRCLGPKRPHYPSSRRNALQTNRGRLGLLGGHRSAGPSSRVGHSAT